MTFEEALAYLTENPVPANEDDWDTVYREACEALAANRDKLTYRVFIHLPGDLRGNSNPAWEAVKAASSELCDCGNERSFEPLDMRHEFQASDAEPVVMSAEDRIYIRAVGAPASSAYMMFELVVAEKGAFWTVMSDPMSTSMDFSLLFSGPKGFPLDTIAEALAKEGKPVPLTRTIGKIENVPMVAISAVDLTAKTLTFILDAAVEVFDPETEKAHAH